MYDIKFLDLSKSLLVSSFRFRALGNLSYNLGKGTIKNSSSFDYLDWEGGGGTTNYFVIF